MDNMNNTAIELIGTAMDTINHQQWTILANPHYNYRHDSTQDLVYFMGTDIGKALEIMSNAWLRLYELQKELKLQESSRVVPTA